jgi:hypothetical protein
MVSVSHYFDSSEFGAIPKTSEWRRIVLLTDNHAPPGMGGACTVG